MNGILRDTTVFASALKGLMSPLKGQAKLVLIFNYHRIGDVDPDNPFHNFHTISEAQFKQHIRLLSTLGQFVSLDDIREARNLSSLNFAITFDDVSRTILSVTPYLETRAIPYAICPCTEITQTGMGIPDKVNFIIKYIPADEVIEFVNEQLGSDFIGDKRKFSFYHITKSDKVHPEIVEAQVIDPLFNRIPKDLIQGEQAYLSWDDIRHNFLENKFATIVNHTRRHLQMGKLTREEIYSDISDSISDFKQYLNFTPAYFAVPFGGIYQDLIMDLTEGLRQHDYKGVLWLGGMANIITQPYNAQLIHLSRIHTPTSYGRFLKRIAWAISQRQSGIIKKIQPAVRKDKFSIAAGECAQQALAFENVVNQGKDFTSDPLYYKYMYRDNPYKNERPDYMAVKSRDRIESTLFYFPLNFSLNSATINGIYTGSWWKLPISSSLMASGMLMLKAQKNEAVIGSYKPSQRITKAFKTWQAVSVNSFSLNIKNRSHSKHIPNGPNVKEYDAYHETMDSLTHQVNEKFVFSIERSPGFDRWRYDQYPLALKKYFVLYANEEPQAYFVTLYKKNILYISDFFTPSVADFALLLDHVGKFCHEAKINAIGLETSLRDISDFLENKFHINPSVFFNYYYFNQDFPDIQSKLETVTDWEHIEFDETQACGDVLLR